MFFEPFVPEGYRSSLFLFCFWLYLLQILLSCCGRERNAAIGTDLEERKNVLGFRPGANESAKYWLSILNGLKNRGVSDILITPVGGLNRFVEAVNTAFPKTEVQRCIIHQIRSSSRYVSYKDIKQFTADLKPVYKAPTEESALTLWTNLKRNGAKKTAWGKKMARQLE